MPKNILPYLLLVLPLFACDEPPDAAAQSLNAVRENIAALSPLLADLGKQVTMLADRFSALVVYSLLAAGALGAIGLIAGVMLGLRAGKTPPSDPPARP